jgi:hypothetical protein
MSNPFLPTSSINDKDAKDVKDNKDAKASILNNATIRETMGKMLAIQKSSNGRRETSNALAYIATSQGFVDAFCKNGLLNELDSKNIDDVRLAMFAAAKLPMDVAEPVFQWACNAMETLLTKHQMDQRAIATAISRLLHEENKHLQWVQALRSQLSGHLPLFQWAGGLLGYLDMDNVEFARFAEWIKKGVIVDVQGTSFLLQINQDDQNNVVAQLSNQGGNATSVNLGPLQINSETIINVAVDANGVATISGIGE